MTPKAKIPFLDLRAQYDTIRDEIQMAMDRVIESQRFILGPEVEALEQDVAMYSNCIFGIGVSSGTDALLTALMALGIQPGDEVITTPYSFFATAGCIVRLGAKPIYVDINPKTYNINSDKIGDAITEHTRVIIPVHLFGQMANMDPIMEIAEQHDLFVIEDSAQAIGAEYKGKRAGSIGHIGCLSFFPSKNLGAFGDGGMVVTNDEALSNKIKVLRGHGANPKYYHQMIGGNFRLDALQASVLRVKLKYLDAWTSSRQQNAEIYRYLFGQVDFPENEIQLPYDAGYGQHTYNQFVIRSKNRDQLKEYLKSKGIDSEIYYPLPLHLQKCFSNYGYRINDFPESEQASMETLALPIYPELTEEMQAIVVEVVINFFKEIRKGVIE